MRGLLLGAALLAVPAGANPRVPALSPVELRIGAELGSKLSKTGERFPIELARPIVIDGAEVVEAGATGEGEVVWAKKAGMSGSAGELVLAARWLDVAGRRLKLRSLHIARAGADRIGDVNTLAIASAASPVPVSMLGYFVAGKQVVLPKGTLATARTAEEFEIDGAEPVAGPPPSDKP